MATHPSPVGRCRSTVGVVDLRGDVTVVAGRPIVALHGVVDLSTLPALRDLLLRAGTDHPGGVLAVDIDGIEVLDDAGMGVLLGAAAQRRGNGGDLVVVASRPSLALRFAATRFDRAVTVVPALAEVPV